MNLFGRRGDDATATQQRDQALVAAAAAQAETERLRRALDALSVGVVLADANGDAQVRNRAAAGFDGHTAVLVTEAVERLLRDAARGRSGAQVIEFFGPPKRVVEVVAEPLDDGGAIATIDDVSERARLDAVRTDFVANISHELKTPVGALAVLAEALVDSEDLVVVQRLANKMVDEAHRVSLAIDDLMELSRIELGGQAVREHVDVDQIVHDAVARARVMADQRSIAISVQADSHLKVLGDSRQLVSALANLIDNAVKYSEGNSTVVVGASRGADGFVALEVRDEGVGIPTRDLDRIFERFYRVDRARSRDTGGTGLGLAIVRHVVTNHGGEVTVTSREGVGSTFTLRLPTPES